jgi:hypothetical protein
MGAHMEKMCSQCGAGFECRQAVGCWCAELPWKLPVPSDTADLAKGCLCPECLRAVVGLGMEQPERERLG